MRDAGRDLAVPGDGPPTRRMYRQLERPSKDLPPELLATEPDIPWQDIARMRDRLAHRHFDTSRSIGIAAATVADDLPLLEAAVSQLVERLA